MPPPSPGSGSTAISGNNTWTAGTARFGEFSLPSAPLMLEDYQVDSIRKHTAAEQWEPLHGLAKRTYWVGKEQEVFQIYLAHDEAKRKGLKGEAHTAFVFEWLAKYMPETLPKKEGLF